MAMEGRIIAGLGASLALMQAEVHPPPFGRHAGDNLPGAYHLHG